MIDVFRLTDDSISCERVDVEDQLLMCQRLWDYRTRCSKMWPFHFSAFLPRDAMLVRHGRVSVCLSVFVTSPSSVETDRAEF